MNSTDNSSSSSHNNHKKVYNKRPQQQQQQPQQQTNKDNNSNSSNNSSKKTQFQDAVVAKSDIGEFAGGYFIMPNPEQDTLKMKRPVMSYQKNPTQRKKLPPTVNQLEQYNQEIENEKLKQQSNNTPQKAQPYYNNNDDSADSPNNATPKKHQQKSLSPVSPSTSSPSTTPLKNVVNTTPLRSSTNSCSPTKKVQSPPINNCWAGGAFNNSPSPSSLPMPNFDDNDDDIQKVTPTQQPQVDLQTITFDLRRLLNITPTISVSES